MALARNRESKEDRLGVVNRKNCFGELSYSFKNSFPKITFVCYHC